MKITLPILLFVCRSASAFASGVSGEPEDKTPALRGRHLQQSGEFYIVNVQKNKVVDVSGGRCARGTNIHLWRRNGTPAQRFRFGPNNSIVNTGCNKVLDVFGGFCFDRTNIQLWDPNGTGAQSWTVEANGGIRNNACNKYIDVRNNDSNDGTNIWLYKWNGTPAQIWKIEYINPNPNQKPSQTSLQGPFPAPLIGAAAAALPDGRVLLWSAYAKYKFGGSGQTWTTIFDPRTKSFSETLVKTTNHDMFCPGLSYLPDGRLMVTGGSNSEKTSIYDPKSNQWSYCFLFGKGYHTTATLATGEVLVLGGSWSGGVGGKDGELFSNGSWSMKRGIRSEAMGTDDVRINNRDYFMWILQAPNGRVLKAGPSKMMHWIDVESNGNYQEAGLRGDDDHAMSGSAVLFDIGMILTVGGSRDFESGVQSSPRSYTIDINGDTPIVERVGNMAWRRTYHDSIVLPSGEVVTVGGKTKAVPFSDADSVYTAEIWSPATGQWTKLSKIKAPRNYHSTALLMRDGRILIAGGGLCGNCAANHADVEIFYPPYLFEADGKLATRPVIRDAPTDIEAGDTIQVRLNSNDPESTFALVRTSSVTHGTNQDQRRVPLDVVGSPKDGWFSLSVPENVNVVIPGPYFLFAMNAAGVPSVAASLRVSVSVEAQPKPTGEFMIVNQANGKVLDVASGRCSDGTNIQLWAKQPGNSNQVFKFGSDGEIIHTACNKAIDVSGGRCRDGTNIQLWRVGGSSNCAQKWIVHSSGAIENPECKMVIDLSGNISRDGRNIHLWSWNNGDAQKWSIEYI